MKILLLIFTLAIHHMDSEAASYYVSSTAAASGTGSIHAPWQLQTALNHPAVLFPGDTVWLRGGVYTNTYDGQTSFSCFTKGTANAPIIFRNYNNERATIDGQQLYSLYLSLGNCSYTWFWGLEVTNSGSSDRSHDIPGGVTCTAENIKFINMIVHDVGSGLDSWKTAKNSETYGCLIYHIGNNLNNNGNWEGHGHGMYLQNDTVSYRTIHNNIVFSTFGYGIKVWQTTTTSAIGNFDIRENIIFNGGAASENLGGAGNNYRTHNFFVVANGAENPIINTTIKKNYTFSGTNTPRPPVNAFGLNFGVKGLTLDSNYLTCQTRLGLNNTPIFEASVKDNKIMGGIPAVYGTYLWGFTQTDYPQNTYLPELPTEGLEYFVLPNKYEAGRAHLVVYNWDSAATVRVNISHIGLKIGDEYELANAMDVYNDIIAGTYDTSGFISVPMTGHSFAQATGSSKAAVSQFPVFGAFIIRKRTSPGTVGVETASTFPAYTIAPNPSRGRFIFTSQRKLTSLQIFNSLGEIVWSTNHSASKREIEIDLSMCPKGTYFLRVRDENAVRTRAITIQ